MSTDAPATGPTTPTPYGESGPGRLALPRPAVHLRRPRQHADPRPAGPRARHPGRDRRGPLRPAAYPSTATSTCIGGGEDGPQALAAQRLNADRGLHRAVERGAALFAVCAGYQLVGTSFFAKGEQCAGLDLLDLRSDRGPTRAVGELAGTPAPALGLPTLTGLREPRWAHPPRRRAHAAGPGDHRHRQRRRHRGRVGRADPRHVHARSGAGPQPGHRRPAAQLGDGSTWSRSTTPGRPDCATSASPPSRLASQCLDQSTGCGGPASRRACWHALNGRLPRNPRAFIGLGCPASSTTWCGAVTKDAFFRAYAPTAGTRRGPACASRARMAASVTCSQPRPACDAGLPARTVSTALSSSTPWVAHAG